MPKLVYENVAIGVIAQRVGECRYSNRYFVDLRMAVTQQVRGLDERYRDTLFLVNDKLLVIEFKAPRVKQGGVLVYEKVNMAKLRRVAQCIGEGNVFIAFIHALLPRTCIVRARPMGFYLWLATPGTTAFVPLIELPQNIKNNNKLSIEVIKAQPCTNFIYASTLIPTCAKQFSLTKQEHHCASCGGLYDGPDQLRKPILTLSGSFGRIHVLSYTLASLAKSFIECKIGCQISEEMARHLAELKELRIGPSTTLLLSCQGTPFLVPLSTIEET